MIIDGVQALTVGGLRPVERLRGRGYQARTRYVSDAYGVDGRDASLYHLMIGSTALDLDTCVELIVTASQARVRQPRATQPS